MKETAQEKVLILIPVFNEARSIRSLILEIRGLYPEMDLLVVDDGSSDNSAGEARAGGATVISHCFNLGDGAARQTGFLYAIRRGHDYIIHLDGDRQHSPREVSLFLDALRRGDVDLVVGSRFLGKHEYNLPLAKKIGMKLFSTICSLVLRQKITDPTSGFRGMNRQAMDVYTNGYYPQHFPDADVIISSYFRGLRIMEIPITVRATQSTSLHRGWTSIYYIYKMLLSTFVSSLRFSRKNNKKN